MKENIIKIDLKEAKIKNTLNKLGQIQADLQVISPNLIYDKSGDEVAQLENSGSAATPDIVSLLSAIHDATCSLLCRLIPNWGEEDTDTDEMMAKYKEIVARKISTKERKDAKDSDFVIPENRSFPILKPADVPAAVHSFGRSKSGVSFEEFKKRLTRIAKRKGFESSLPKEWSENK